MKMRKVLSVFLITTLSFVLIPFWSAQAATITVNTNNDVLDAAADCASVTLASLPGTDGFVSLREAMCAANTNPEPDTINFNIIGVGGHTISLLSALPQFVDDATTIDGYSQPGASPASNSSPATILISLNGTGVVNNGLNVTSSGNVIQGLAIYGFPLNGIWVANYAGGIANDNVIAGNYLGMNGSGAFCLGNGVNGVFIGLGAQNNRIGGGAPADRNLIPCNGYEGVGIHGSGTTGNIVSGNYIGTDPTGTLPLANTTQGVRIYGGAQNNTVGGNTLGERNLISGNTEEGVLLMGSGTNGNMISGNYIGTDVSGEGVLPNGGRGITIRDGAQGNLVGGDNATPGGACSGACNLIAGNSSTGVYIYGDNTADNTISGNYIGTDRTGMTSLSNHGGIIIGSGGNDNLVGGDTAGERNIISGNGRDGIYIYEVTHRFATTDDDLLSIPHSVTAQGNVISGNYIGTDVTGLTALGNDWSGVTIGPEAQDTIIGGDSPGERNIISGNGDYGVELNFTDGNVISGNFIGTDFTGTARLQNDEGGIYLRQSHDNVIGGDSVDERNIISGNGQLGVNLTGDFATGNIFYGNYIGLDVSGTVNLGNVIHGLVIENGAHDNIIGGDTPGERNIISGNGNYGIAIFDADTDGNQITGNYIGTDASGHADMGNGGIGVIIYGGPQDNLIGPANRIAYNNHGGIVFSQIESTGNVITQNSIYANEMFGGITLEAGANNDMPAPTILLTSQGSVFIQGTALPSSTVELFASPTADGQGKTYLGSAVAEAVGAYTLEIDFLPHPFLTATATDSTDGTSEFSDVFSSTVQFLSLPLVLK